MAYSNVAYLASIPLPFYNLAAQLGDRKSNSWVFINAYISPLLLQKPADTSLPVIHDFNLLSDEQPRNRDLYFPSSN